MKLAHADKNSCILTFIFYVTFTITDSTNSLSSADSDSHAAGSTTSNLRLNKHEKLIVLSFDGFRYDYLDKVAAPNLQRLKNNGVWAKSMKPVFPTKTFVNHQSLVTGLYAESHGIVDNKCYDPKYREFLNGHVQFNEKLWNYDDNVVPIWILNEWAGDGRVSGAAFPGANQPYGANQTLPHYYLAYNESLPFEERIDIVFSWLTHKEHPANLIFMYFDEPDTSGHQFGPESDELKRAVERMDGVTKYFIDKMTSAGIMDQVNVMIWSDHGMQEVSLGDRIDLTSLVNMPGTYDRFGGAAVVQIQPHAGTESTVYDAFKLASIDRPFSVYKRSQIPARWHYAGTRRIMDILVVADPGSVFQPSLSNTSLKFGVHGYDNEAKNMTPFFIAHGPRFKRNYEAPRFTNIDLFPLIAHIMGFYPAPNNGSLENVIGMLNSGFRSGKSGQGEKYTFLMVCLLIYLRDV